MLFPGKHFQPLPRPPCAGILTEADRENGADNCWGGQELEEYADLSSLRHEPSKRFGDITMLDVYSFCTAYCLTDHGETATGDGSFSKRTYAFSCSRRTWLQRQDRDGNSLESAPTEYDRKGRVTSRGYFHLKGLNYETKMSAQWYPFPAFELACRAVEKRRQ